MMPNIGFNFMVCGTVRNVSKTLEGDVYRLIESIKIFNKLDWFLVESDSQDNTLEVLKKLKSNLKGFDYVSLGTLSKRFPERIDRLYRCRDTYSNYVNSLGSNNYDYIVVMDFDGINNQLTNNAFWSNWERDDWDVVTANQDGPYYDIWALKHKYWNPVDCYQQSNFFSRYIQHNLAILANVSLKQIVIPKDHDWIEVESSFGGIAIYKKDVFLRGKTYTPSKDMGVVCDHITFHQHIRSHGFKIFINPLFINADFTEHTNWLKPGLNRIKLKLKLFIILFFGSNVLKFIKKFL